MTDYKLEGDATASTLQLTRFEVFSPNALVGAAEGRMGSWQLDLQAGRQADAHVCLTWALPGDCEAGLRPPPPCVCCRLTCAPSTSPRPSIPDCSPVLQAQPAAAPPPTLHSLLQGLNCRRPRLLSAAVRPAQWSGARRRPTRQCQLHPCALASRHSQRPRGRSRSPGSGTAGVQKDNRRADGRAATLRLWGEAQASPRWFATRRCHPQRQPPAQAGAHGLAGAGPSSPRMV